jgi:hypothetical protein
MQFLPESKRFISSPNHPELGYEAHPTSYSMGTGDSLLHKQIGFGMRLTTHLHLVLKLSMSGAVPPLSLYSFMECIHITLPLWFY